MGFWDGLQNLVANLGTDRDKAAATSYVLRVMTAPELEVAYRESPLARRIVDMPAEDAFREWRAWQAPADAITALEAEEKRLRLQWSLIRAAKDARLHGGSAIYIGVKDGADPSMPLNPRAIQKGGLQYLAVLGRYEITPGEIQRDPRQSGYGKPRVYTMQTGSASVTVHPSRLVVLTGEDIPTGSTLTVLDGWGDSVLNGVLDTIKRVDSTAANIASLVFEAKIDVLKVHDFFANLASRGESYVDEWKRRNALVMAAKGINGTLLMDAQDEYEQKSASFGGLHEVMDRMMQMAASAAQMPMTLLFGMSPGGLNATGDSDIRGYYDRIKAMQSLEYEPAISVLDECLIRSALGARPDDLHYTWRPLWQPTGKERAETGKILAETLDIADRMGVVSTEALGVALVNGLTECGAFPGLEDAAAEFPAGDDDEPDDEPAPRVETDE